MVVLREAYEERGGGGDQDIAVQCQYACTQTAIDHWPFGKGAGFLSRLHIPVFLGDACDDRHIGWFLDVLDHDFEESMGGYKDLQIAAAYLVNNITSRFLLS